MILYGDHANSSYSLDWWDVWIWVLQIKEQQNISNLWVHFYKKISFSFCWVYDFLICQWEDMSSPWKPVNFLNFFFGGGGETSETLTCAHILHSGPLALKQSPSKLSWFTVLSKAPSLPLAQSLDASKGDPLIPLSFLFLLLESRCFRADWKRHEVKY